MVYFKKMNINESTGSAKLNVGDEMPKFKLSDVKVVNLVTGEENENLYWVEQV